MTPNNIYQGNCLDVLKDFPDNSIDSIVTDPPYELGFMGKSWDSTGIANNKEMWAECLRVLKPGGHLLAFSGTRTYHRMASAIEDAGFEVRDMIEWVYSTGFPKSLNVKKQLEKTYGTKKKSEHDLRPMSESDLSEEVNTTKEQGEILQSGLSEQSISLSGNSTSNDEREESSLERRDNLQETEGKLQGCPLCEMSEKISTNGEKGWVHNGTQISNGSTFEQIINESGSSPSHRPQSEQQRNFKLNALCEQCLTQEIRRYDGIGTALKPAHEPICMARKPLSESTVAENCLKWGTGGINIDESRVEGVTKHNYVMRNYEKTFESTQGRFPANLIHDGSDEVKECFPNESERFFKSIIYQAKASKSERNKGCDGLEEGEVVRQGLAGEHNNPTHKNNHPTVKPIALMEYLIKMVTPKGGIVLDPFTGSGSTLVAAKQNGFQYVGIEMTPEYIEIAQARLK